MSEHATKIQTKLLKIKTNSVNKIICVADTKSRVLPNLRLEISDNYIRYDNKIN